MSKFSIRKHWSVAKVELKIFLENANNEVEETREAGIILKKYSAGHKLTKEERKKLREQIFDVLKGVGIVVPFALIPGATLILPFLIKFGNKNGIKIMPSSFNKKIKNEEPRNN